ncbi:Hypothetical predicted protein [Paramuricea clavata]|nr:Hypothetical predicted protein [Paramuricea clavata]
MLQSEDACLNMEQARVEHEKRKHEAQKRFLNQMDFYHPLRTQDNLKTRKAVFGNSARKQAKHPSEHDQKSANTAKSFKILQRTETDGRPDPARRYSPVNARRSSPSSMTPSGNQESYPNTTRSLSPSSNSAFTRVSRVNNTRRARPKNKQQAKSPTTSIDMTFTAPAWTNFKFDKGKILEAFRA